MKINENTSLSMPIKNMLAIIGGVIIGVLAWSDLTARLTSLETSRELFQADLLKKSEQLPTDQEQYMLLEALFSDVEKLQKNQEQNMTNKVNIEFTQKQLEKLLSDVEELKDKVRANGSHQ
jgi:hypothetical protein|tara:strand:+ start:49 stop:411 length:363 start_codon:yes stop_codon:yes gene_type:complete